MPPIMSQPTSLRWKEDRGSTPGRVLVKCPQPPKLSHASSCPPSLETTIWRKTRRDESKRGHHLGPYPRAITSTCDLISAGGRQLTCAYPSHSQRCSAQSLDSTARPLVHPQWTSTKKSWTKTPLAQRAASSVHLMPFVSKQFLMHCAPVLTPVPTADASSFSPR